MGQIFYWTGAAVWVAVAIVLLFMAYELMRGFIAAMSWYRWAILEVRRLGRDVPYGEMAKGFFSAWGDLIGHRKGNQKWTTYNGAQWRNIGDWNLGNTMPEKNHDQ